ncbi:hypothetical protein EU522_01485 [Candidatus Thorarchaeota archaeon]|nr:MAG: hypothetical protein EU522_01485 [Candidatus Thorarchaeota archaeon]
MKLTLDYREPEQVESCLGFDIDIWSHNKPILLMRHTTTNVSTKEVEELKVYHMMDFDIGGPSSYKDDIGAFSKEKGIMYAFDESSLSVALASRPNPDGWEISPPIHLRLDETNNDLNNNLQNGPRDIATAIQWNLGDLKPNKSAVVEIALVATTSQDELEALVAEAWRLFDKKVR